MTVLDETQKQTPAMLANGKKTRSGAFLHDLAIVGGLFFLAAFGAALGHQATVNGYWPKGQTFPSLSIVSPTPHLRSVWPTTNNKPVKVAKHRKTASTVQACGNVGQPDFGYFANCSSRR